MMERVKVKRNKPRIKVGPVFRELTEQEAHEEGIYRSQLRAKWSFVSGGSPVELFEKKQKDEGEQ